jgi:predicted PurR-regulated permease PerM
MKDPSQGRSIVRIEIAPSTVGWILLALGGVWLLGQLRVVVLLVVVALIIAGTFNPLIEGMERRGVKRIWALVLLFLGAVVIAALLLFLTVPPLMAQMVEIMRAAPGHREALIASLERNSFTLPLAHVVQGAGQGDLAGRIETYLLGYSSRTVMVVGYFATAVVLALYFLADGKRTQGTLYALVPRGYHMRLARILHNLEEIVGGYMRGQLITSSAIGLFTFTLLVICQVPNALSLALFAALTDVIPFVGIIIGAAPAVLSALPRGAGVALAVTIALFVYMEFESRVLIPRVYGQVLRLSPAVVVLALLVGGTLLGVIGALLALPIAAGLQMILHELQVELPGDDSEDRPAQDRNARSEATYERLSAGATAPDAGLIARELAHDLREEEAKAEAAAGLAKRAQAGETKP